MELTNITVQRSSCEYHCIARPLETSMTCRSTVRWCCAAAGGDGAALRASRGHRGVRSEQADHVHRHDQGRWSGRTRISIPQVEVKEADGKTVVYRVEGAAPNSLFRQGWRPDTLKVGDVVTVSGIRAKSETSMNIGLGDDHDGRRQEDLGTGGAERRRNR